jgi:formate hydrogenlyase transcriptional activator
MVVTIAIPALPPRPPKTPAKSSGTSLKGTLGDAERAEILKALEESNWIVAGPNGAAARLGMKRSTLQFRMQRLGIQITRSGSSSK